MPLGNLQDKVWFHHSTNETAEVQIAVPLVHTKQLQSEQWLDHIASVKVAKADAM